MEPPPSITLQRHWAQVPPPPQAEDRKIPASESVVNNLPPALAVIVFSGSPLISIVIFFLIFKPLQRSNLRKLFSEQFRTDGSIPFEIELTDSQIRTTQAGIETALNWSSLEDIEESADATHFWFDHKGLVSVRNDAFASAQERGEFVSFARGRMGEAASSKAVAADEHADRDTETA